MDIYDHCLSKYGSVPTLPFGPSPICFKVGGKIFAQLYDDKLTLKCSRFQGELFRSLWPDIVVRGYHCPPIQQPYWNTFDLSRFPEAELPGMIDLAYQTVLDSFSRRKRAEILGPMGTTVTVQVDRPLGTCHPNHRDICYPVNYGFIPGTLAPDGEEQDAYILGIDHPVDHFTGTVIAVIHRENDCEDKWVVAPEGMTFSPAQIRNAVQFQEQYFRTRICTL